MIFFALKTWLALPYALMLVQRGTASLFLKTAPCLLFGLVSLERCNFIFSFFLSEEQRKSYSEIITVFAEKKGKILEGWKRERGAVFIGT